MLLRLDSYIYDRQDDTILVPNPAAATLERQAAPAVDHHAAAMAELPSTRAIIE